MEFSGNCCLISEFAAVVRVSGTIKVLSSNEISVRIITENAAFARRIFSMVKRLYNIYPEVVIRKSKKLKKHTSYIIAMTSQSIIREIMDNSGVLYKAGADLKLVDWELFHKRRLKSNCCRKAYLRGAFLAGGSISDPEKTYHLEITNHDMYLADEICSLVNKFELNAKVIKRKGNYVTYLKEGENIVDFLNIIGAHSALMELENVRILKEMRNNVNRVVNCETANLEKTVNASVRQVDNIKYIRDNIGFDSLPNNLQEIAELRLAFSDVNLKELGQMLNPPLGKSGVNHRLRKLDEIAENVRKLKGEF